MGTSAHNKRGKNGTTCFTNKDDRFPEEIEAWGSIVHISHGGQLNSEYWLHMRASSSDF